MTVFSPLYGQQNMAFLYAEVQKLARGGSMICDLSSIICSADPLNFLLYKLFSRMCTVLSPTVHALLGSHQVSVLVGDLCTVRSSREQVSSLGQQMSLAGDQGPVQ